MKNKTKNESLDISILYAARELEPYLKLKENKKLDLVSVPPPRPYSDFDTGNPWMDSIMGFPDRS